MSKHFCNSLITVNYLTVDLFFRLVTLELTPPLLAPTYLPLPLTHREIMTDSNLIICHVRENKTETAIMKSFLKLTQPSWWNSSNQNAHFRTLRTAFSCCLSQFKAYFDNERKTTSLCIWLEAQDEILSLRKYLPREHLPCLRFTVRVFFLWCFQMHNYRREGSPPRTIRSTAGVNFLTLLKLWGREGAKNGVKHPKGSRGGYPQEWKEPLIYINHHFEEGLMDFGIFLFSNVSLNRYGRSPIPDLNASISSDCNSLSGHFPIFRNSIPIYLSS